MIFFLDINPPTATAQEKKIAVRNGRTFVYDNPRVKDAKRLLMFELRKFIPDVPLDGPISLVVRWDFPRGKHAYGLKTTKPDTDNLQKMLKDCMTKVGFWNDDAQVAYETITKYWSDNPGIYISVNKMEDSK